MTAAFLSSSADPEPAGSEAPFDRARRRIGVWLGPAVFLLLLVAPLPLPAGAHRLAAVMGLVIVYWMTEPVPLPVTALLGPALAVLLGVAPVRRAMEPFADPVIFLFLGSFLLAEALRVHGLDRRLALSILALPGVADSAGRIRLAVALVTAGISMWISNTATAAMMLPIALGLVRALKAAGSTDPPRALLLLVGMAASLGGVATPVGTPPNLIAMGFLDQAGRGMGFLQFMAIGVPLSLALTGAAVVVASRLLPSAARRGARGRVGGRAAGRDATWRPGEKACATAFASAIVLWLLPGILTLLGAAEGGPLRAATQRLGGVGGRPAVRGAALPVAGRGGTARARMARRGPDRLGHPAAVRRRPLAGPHGVRDRAGRHPRPRRAAGHGRTKPVGPDRPDALRHASCSRRRSPTPPP